MKRDKTYPSLRQDVCAYYYKRCQITPIEGTRAKPPSVSVKQVDRLPLLIRESQWIKFADRYFFISREGLYRFWDWGKVKMMDTEERPQVVESKQRYSSLIFYRGDILMLLSSLALVHVHGTAHETPKVLGFDECMKHAKEGVLSLTCGSISDIVCRLLSNLGWKVRRVGAMRIEGLYNTYDNGHQLFEFYWPKFRKWVLADVDGHVMFTRNKRYLNLGEISHLIQQGKDFTLEPLTTSGLGAVDSSNAFFYFFCEPIFLDPLLKKKWYHHMLAIPLIRADDDTRRFFCQDSKARRRVERYSPAYKSMDKKDWLSKFYG